MNFGRVKISQSHDIPADVIANNLSVDVHEVELAFTFESFAEYAKA